MVENDKKLPPVMTSLTSSLCQAEKVLCSTHQSWIFRRGFDRAYYAMPTNR
jgi:hypothetical protein